MRKIPEITYPELPIVNEKDRIIEAIRQYQVVIVAGDTGSGKTTQLPKMCLEAGRGEKKLIGCTQPRRIAAAAVAARVSQELGEIGESLVGYKIRFQDRTSRSTKIKFMTDGILLAETTRDRFLKAYDTIIVDEAHERSLNIDFLLGILRRLLNCRPDLKVIITSATIDTEKFSKSFNDAPIIEVAGRCYPVELRYEPIDPEKEEAGDTTYVEQAVKAVCEIRRKALPGDILVFMPTEKDIRETESSLTGFLKKKGDNALILPLFGRMSVADQRRIFRSDKKNKIVVATNIAETSITVPGIRYVIDTGLARFAVYNARARTGKLPILPISRASADQRKGRCGRIGPGVCIRLYPEEDYNNRFEFTPPEIQRSNLADVILRMIYLGLGDPADFPFIDPPASRSIKDGYHLLRELGAITQTGAGFSQTRLTHKGRLMARLPLDPRISRMVIEAQPRNALREIMVIAAALSVQDPRVRPVGQEKEADAMHAGFVDRQSDYMSFLKIWDTYHNTLEKIKSQSRMRKFCRSHYLVYQRLREWLDIHEQIRNILLQEDGFAENTAPADYAAVHQALLSGNLRNIGMKKAKNIYLGGQGKELMIFPGSALFNKAGQWIMAAEIIETSKLYARTVAEIKPEWIEPLARDLCRFSYASPHWEKGSGRVVATEKVTLFGLLIVPGRQVNFGRIRPDEARRIFIQSALVEGEIKRGYPFFDHNRQLIEKFQDFEDRLRQRNIMADEFTLYTFYDDRLPENVWDQATFNAFLEKKGDDGFLRMSEADILMQGPETERLNDFPHQLVINNIPYQLTYRFEPGSDDDGVSVHVPFSLLPEVDPQIFDWLVPGLVRDKIIFLIKGLPKNIRKQLVPVAPTATRLLEALSIYQGNFYRALEIAIFKQFGVRVQRRDWPMATLPEHFQMRFCLVGEHGKIIKSHRSFSKLTSMNVKRSQSDDLDVLRRKWERAGIKSWDFADLPDKIPLQGTAGDLQGFAYPGLVDQGNGTVAIRLCRSFQESRGLTAQGLLALYEIYFLKQFKAAKKDFALPKKSWALYQGFAPYEQFNNELLDFIMAAVFEVGHGGIPAKNVFDEKVESVRSKGLYNIGKEIFEKTVEVLRERRETFDMIDRYAQMAGKSVDNVKRFEEYRSQAGALVPPFFLKEFDLPRLNAVPRYLRALRIRIERAHAAPTKDAAKAVQAGPHIVRLEQMENRLKGEKAAAVIENTMFVERRTALDEYREMVEEFKISLFAPEIKTLYPVSAKRLEKKWQEVEQLF